MHDSGPGDIPNTGVTRHCDFNVACNIIAPDGVNKSSMVMDKQYPGVSKSIVLSCGDRLIGYSQLLKQNGGGFIDVIIHNIGFGPSEGTTMHW